jgi:hypothetical protein
VACSRARTRGRGRGATDIALIEQATLRKRQLQALPSATAARPESPEQLADNPEFAAKAKRNVDRAELGHFSQAAVK